jgi:3-methyladenine DNA glycosylase AlkD
MYNNFDYKKVAGNIFFDIQELDLENVPNLRRIRKEYSKILKDIDGEFIINLARYYIKRYGYHWIVYEIIYCHPNAINCIGMAELEEFGQGINSWGRVDVFACYIAGQALRNNQVGIDLIRSWAKSEDRWWRRAALISTIPLNRPTAGGKGDVPQTLEICRLLVADRDDMVVKALSWALRELIRYDANGVRKFVNENSQVLASRVKREVRNKLELGLKNPRRKRK